MAFRANRIAIYARARPSRDPHEYELVVIQNRPQSVMPDGSIIPAREGYPENSEWGKCAWSFPVREKELVWELARRMTLRDAVACDCCIYPTETGAARALQNPYPRMRSD
jgi:hypothetical protein